MLDDVKIPYIKCTSEMWKYIKPYLENWDYKSRVTPDWINYPLLVINECGVLGVCNNYDYNTYIEDDYNRELINNVEEFLERAATLKGFIYKRKDIMKIHGIEIKPGMGIYVNSINAENLYIVIPTKKGLGVIAYGLYSYWELIDPFLKENYNKIVRICDIPNSLIEGDILWEKPIEIILTMDEIAEKFGYNVEQIKIMK